MKRIFLVCLTVVALLGGALRFGYHAMPNPFPDEAITVEVLRHMRQSGNWDVNWRLAELSPDLRYDQYNFSSHLYATYFFYRLVKVLPGTLAWRSERDGVVVYRFLAAALASLVVLQTFRLGWTAAGRTGAVVAGLLAAISTLLVQDAHYIRPEPFMTVLTLATVALCLPSSRFAGSRAALAGLCVGLLIACKISMVMLAWLPFVPLFTAPRLVPVWRPALGVALATAGGFVIGAPGALMNPEAFAHGIRKLSEQYRDIHPPHSHADAGPVADLLGKYFAATLGWPIIAAFAVGIFALVRVRAWGRLLVLAGPVLVFLGGFATRSVFFERNLSPVVPLIFVLVAIGVGAMTRALSGRLPGFAVAGAILAVLVLRPASLTYRLVTQEYTGRRAHEQDQFEVALRAAHPGAEWRTGTLLSGWLAESLKQHFEAGGGEVLLRATDYRDDTSRANRGPLEERFRVELLADRRGLFPEVPTGTLLTYHSPPERYYLVRGLR